MASTLTKIILHITFSTKNRTALIPEALEPDLYAYIGGICRRLNSPLLAMGGTTDHVHMMVSLDKTTALSDFMLALRTYIAHQKEHHKAVDFKDEVRAFLKKYNLEWDERYIWD